MVSPGRVAVLWGAVILQVLASPSGVRRATLTNAATQNEANVAPRTARVGKLRGSQPRSAELGRGSQTSDEVPAVLNHILARTEAVEKNASAAEVGVDINVRPSGNQSRPLMGLTSVAIEPHQVDAPPSSHLVTDAKLRPLVEGNEVAKIDQRKTGLARPAPAEQGEINPNTGEPITDRQKELSEDKYGIYLGMSIAMMASGFLLWCCFLPYLLLWQWNEYKQLGSPEDHGRQFSEFLTYRMNNWLNTEGLAANAKILLGGAISLISAGAFFYTLVTGRKASEGLWLVFLWVSASSVEAGTPRASGVIGAIVTMGGLVLLAILLATITDFFQAKVQASKEGRDAVVEGGHILVVGHNPNTKTLLEELALAQPDEPMTVVLLDTKTKAEVESQIAAANTQLGNLKLVVRSGSGSSCMDLKKVAADTALKIVIPEDPNSTREESDATTFGTLITLKGKGWPKSPDSYIVAQSCLTRNDTLMRDLGPDPTLVVNGERLGRLMVQSARDHGLCHVFSSIIGFDGDEFYSKPARELNVVGWRFDQLAFAFPTAVPIGVLDGSGEFIVNPPRESVIGVDEQVIFLAEDEDSVGIAQKKFFDYNSWKTSRKACEFEEANAHDYEKATILICNFSDRGVGCAILFALDETVAPGSEVDIYCGMTEEEMSYTLENAQNRQGRKLQNVRINTKTAPPKCMASLHYMEALRVREYDHIFVLADMEAESQQKADEKAVAMIIQIRTLILRENLSFHFDPVVETCTKIAEQQLMHVGIDNTVNTSLILSRALALVTMKKESYGVLMDLLSVDGNNFDIQQMSSYIAEGEQIPVEITFAEATAMVFHAAQQILIGWSEEVPTGDGEVTETKFVMNPKNKLEPRPWSAQDRLVVIKDV